MKHLKHRQLIVTTVNLVFGSVAEGVVPHTRVIRVIS